MSRGNIPTGMHTISVWGNKCNILQADIEIFPGGGEEKISRRNEKYSWESALGDMPKREQEMSEEERKIEGEIEEKRFNDRRGDALRSRWKIVQKGTKKAGTEKTESSSRERYKISNIPTEAGPLKDQEIIKSEGREMIISEGADNLEEDDTPMSGATSTIEDAEEFEAAQREVETGKPCLKREKYSHAKID